MSEKKPRIASRTAFVAALAHGIAASVFTSLYAPTSIALFAFVFGCLGAVVGSRLARTPIRTPVLVLLGALVVVLGLSLNAVVTGMSLIPKLLGPTLSLRVGEVGAFATSCLGVSLGLRGLSTRLRSFVALEVVAFAAVAIQQLAGHRFGAIHRPFEIADVMLLAGQDPAIAFYAFGALAAVVVAMFLLRERSLGRAAYHGFFLVGLLTLCLVSSITGALPVPSPQAASGGSEQKDEPSQSPSGEGSQGGGGGRGKVTMAVVVFHDDYSPPHETYYFRTQSFTRFVGPRLVSGIDPDLASEVPERPTRVSEPPPSGAERVELETTVGVLVRDPRPIALESPILYEPEPNKNPQRFSAVYRVTSLASTITTVETAGSQVGSSSWSEQERALYTAPHPDSRYRELAQTIVDELLPPDLRLDPVAQSVAITTWLGNEGVYSLHHLQEDGADPASEFLFGERIGYCVHFAHSAVHLMRSLGIPSRVGAGFAVAESERQGGSSLLLMQHMAHAWPEIYVEGQGWMVEDVFPQRSLEPPFEPTDVELARVLGEMARGEVPPPSVPPTHASEAIASVIRAAPQYARYAGYAFLAAIIGLYLLKIGRRVHPRLAGEKTLAIAAYRSVTDAYAEAGIRRARGESREAFARRICARAPSFVPVTSALEARAFGGEAHRKTSKDLGAQSVEARRELRSFVPIWRRVLAIVDPISFLTAR